METIEKRIDEKTGKIWWGCNWCSALHEDEAIMRQHEQQHKIGPDLSVEEEAELLEEMGRVDEQIAAEGIWQLTASGHLDMRKALKHYQDVGRPRSQMLKELRLLIASRLPSLTEPQIDRQVQLAANGIFVDTKEHLYRRREAFHITH